VRGEARAGWYNALMLRRTGYILGLLFVLACALAYAMTWNRVHSVKRLSPSGVFVIRVESGNLTVGAVDATYYGQHRPAYAFWTHGSGPADFNRAELYRVGHESDAESRRVFAPLWMPALAVALFMAWRWRRERTRRQALGFPVADNRG
jgi:hypothetical protein